MRKKIVDTIIESINDFNEGLPENEQIDTDLDSPFYGNNSNLDSMGLVSLIVGIEQNIEDNFNVSISLADERAMSQKSSPYQTINILTDYILKLL
jgi:D-alanine--poly(phosphoribitol) ligase subunit 2